MYHREPIQISMAFEEPRSEKNKAAIIIGTAIVKVIKSLANQTAVILALSLYKSFKKTPPAEVMMAKIIIIIERIIDILNLLLFIFLPPKISKLYP